MRTLFIFEDREQAARAGFLPDGRHKGDMRVQAAIGWWPQRGSPEERLRGSQFSMVIACAPDAEAYRANITAWCLRLPPSLWVEL